MDKRELRLLIDEFNIAYCDALDNLDLERWTTFFSEDALYKVTSRDNVEQGLEGGLMFDDGLPMIKDRAYILTNTQYFAPRRVLHVCSSAFVTTMTADYIGSRTNFVYVETLVEELPRLHMAGQYNDRFRLIDDQLKLCERLVIYDNYMIDSALIYPV